MAKDRFTSLLQMLKKKLQVECKAYLQDYERISEDKNGVQERQIILKPVAFDDYTQLVRTSENMMVDNGNGGVDQDVDALGLDQGDEQYKAQ